jgi:deazaflavin-dependent oxidoreductase (nitroreductase family)
MTEPTFARKRATPLLRQLLKVPVLLYRGPLADLLRSRCVMLLTTRGRKSGLPRTGAISFMPVEDHFVVFSGWGTSSNWYRNVRANPDVTITVGRRRLRGQARLVEDPERRISLMRQMQLRSGGCGPPKPLRPLIKLTGIFDYDGEIEMAVAAGGSLPVIEIFVASAA